MRFPESSGLSLAQVWQIEPGRTEEPDVVWCGVEPAALFRSDDAGVSWAPVEGLLKHEHRPKWMPGGGGLCLHTIVLDPTNPDRMGIAISTAGFYRTDDGGKTWQARNDGVRAVFLPDQHPEFGQCVHKVTHHLARPERLFLQNHWGLYRSDDWGDSWQDIANGVPSDFGFPIQMHPHEPDTVYIDPAAVGRVPRRPRGEAARLPHAGRGRVVGAAHRRTAAVARVRERAARRARRRLARSGGGLLRHAQREALRLARRRRALEGDRRSAAADLLREDRRGRHGLTRVDRMGVSVVLPRALAAATRVAWARFGSTEPCPTVRDALQATAAQWPAVIDRVLTEQGALRRHVNVFVGDESIAFLDGLDTRVDEDATITIVPAVSGGELSSRAQSRDLHSSCASAPRMHQERRAQGDQGG